jgi:uncharacterized repeat protein (TIGR01451 family)
MRLTHLFSGSTWLVRLAASAGLVTRIPSRASRATGCARAKTSGFFIETAILLVAGFCLQASAVRAATPPGVPITNSASASYDNGGSVVLATGSITVTTALETPATIELLRYAPGVGSAAVMVSPTQCKGANLPAPIVPGTGALVLPAVQPLATANTYARGDPVMIKLTDYDQNKNPLLAETVVVTVTTSVGDSETLTLTETGLSTGVFAGFIQSSSFPVTPDNCVLNIGANAKISASYKDGSSGGTIISAAALVDPFGVVFDSTTGLPVSGAQITVINVATGLPAQVFGNDGTSIFPSTVISGGTVTDAGGEVYTFAPGAYQFPRMAVGTYRFSIVPPASYSAPSVVADANLQVLPGAPFVLMPGSRGQNFLLADGPALRIDIPLDPASGANVQITKTAGKATVAIGEFVPYLLAIANGGKNAVPALRIADRLPLGFRYQSGSARWGTSVLADPVVSLDGRGLEFSLGTLAGNATLALRYVATVNVGAVNGPAENTAQAVGNVKSNIARASVLVREDLNRSSSNLVGRVTVGESCERDFEDNYAINSEERKHLNKFGDKPLGIKGVRVLLQDGTYVVTDEDGNWHTSNIRPGTHVVQLDETSLPQGIELELCDKNNRTNGRSFSQFVNVQGGTLWRADFRFKAARNTMPQKASAIVPSANGATASLQLVEKLPYDDQWIAQAKPGAEWLHPQSGFAPALPVVKVAVKHDAQHRVELKVNGELVNALRYEGMTMNLAATTALSNWRSVDVQEGDNQLEVTVRDPQGQTVLHDTRTIHYAAGPSTVALDTKLSRLIADGRTSPVIAMRMLDKDGKPARRGASGEFQLNAPYLTQEQANAMLLEPLANNANGKPRFQIGEDGIALIALQPTTQSGEVVLRFDFGNGTRPQEVKTWLTPDLRDWVLVGFAEGTAGYKGLSGNMESLVASGTDEKLYDQNRIAFFGKGQIKGEYLLTVAYDSAKGANNAAARLKQAIDPNQYYTLYADATQPQFDAASVSKLYLKIEKSQFYALFGDYDTGLVATELGRYSRTLNGLKSEFKGEQFSYNAFASQTTQSFRKDEIQGDGTSGLYRLNSRDIVVNSDKLTIEVRDRFRPEVIISTRNLTRFLDYQIDFALGTVFFTQPIASRDEHFNPVMIVAEYESESQVDAKLSYGGRVGVKVGEKTELGLTHINEGIGGREASLTAADATVQLGANTKLRAELAQSKRTAVAGPESGNAMVLEISHDDGQMAGRVYSRLQDTGFGLGLQAASEAGTRKMGSDVQVKVSDSVQIKAEAYSQENLATQAQRDVVEVQAQWVVPEITVTTGLRMANEKDQTGIAKNLRQLIGGVGYDLLDNRLKLRANTELDLAATSDSVTYPNRLVFGADYKLTSKTTVFAEHEMARSTALRADMTRVGMRAQPWDGAEVSSSVGNQVGADGDRMVGNLGLVQKLKINDKWAADFGLDRSHTVSAITPNTFNSTQAPASGSLTQSALPQSSGSGFNGVPRLATGDYTALFLGAAYQDVDWTSNIRLEWRTSDTDKKMNLLMGTQRKLESGRTVAAGLTYTQVEGAQNSSQLNARLSYAHRPVNTSLIWLDRLEYQADTQEDVNPSVRTRKLINNFNANWLPDRGTQIAFQHGAKYVFDTIDNSNYHGFTSLLGLEARKDITEKVDFGVHLGSLSSWASGARDYQIGVSVGFRVADNAWFSVGYNHRGFNDPDFSGAPFRAQGLYLNLRLKFDQNTFNLNNNNQSQLSLKQ